MSRGKWAEVRAICMDRRCIRRMEPGGDVSEVLDDC
jgi:hypothetical protein